MKIKHELWHWPEGKARGESRGRFDTRREAMTTAGYPEPDAWSTGSHGGPYIPLPDGGRTGRYQSWAITEVREPEIDAERIELALELALEHGQTDGAHHKTWVIDQVVRVLTGDRYEQVITEWCDGEDGPETYAWDEGIAP